MSDKSFLVLADMVLFLPSLGGPAILMAPAMVPVTSKSKNLASFRGITLEGDEKQWIVYAAPYTNPPHVIPGVVMCKIKKLHSSHIAKKIQESGKSVLLVGNAPFDAEFQVLVPAMEPPKAPLDPPKPDPKPMYQGKGKFIQPADSRVENNG